MSSVQFPSVTSSLRSGKVVVLVEAICGTLFVSTSCNCSTQFRMLDTSLVKCSISLSSNLMRARLATFLMSFVSMDMVLLFLLEMWGFL